MLELDFEVQIFEIIFSHCRKLKAEREVQSQHRSMFEKIREMSQQYEQNVFA